MLVYTVKSLPDLTLSKYQVFADSGIDGMLEAHTQFIRQMSRILLLGKINLHILYDYNPSLPSGEKLRIFIIFSGLNSDDLYAGKIKKIVSASNICRYFDVKEFDNIEDLKETDYTYMTVLHKKERVLQTVVDNENHNFYIVPNWEINEESRLYSMLQLIQSFDVKCCYRVDLYVSENLEEQIHHSFESPLSFLRNISTRSGLPQLSDFSKIQYKRDPNCDEALHQYENWLKTVDDSSIFRCRISALSDDKQISQLILNCGISECIRSGNAVTKSATGSFDCFSFINELPDGLHMNQTPQSLKNWTTTFTAEEAAVFCRLPILYDGETIELPKETAAKQEKDGIILGTDTNGYPVAIPQELFPKHMFVCGVPGSGKTNTMLHIANSLWNTKVREPDGSTHKLHIPFLVLEPAKREYRELALFDIPELLVFSPSACTNFPIYINPFEFPVGLTLSEHISKLCQVFEGAFPIAAPAPFILDKAIQAIYEKKGWSYRDINTGNKPYPVMQELYNQFELELQTTNYSNEIKGNISSVLEMRIGSLLRREMKDIFNAERSTIAPEEWLTKPIIVELEALGEGPANFVTLLLCTLIRETLKADPLKDKDKPIRHIIFIEEAHNLIAPEAQVKDGMDSNPKVAATAFIVKMLAEVRALREGIIIADQLPTAMAPEVIKNTNIKLVHRLTSGDDRELVGSTMSASGLQMENMATYTSGQALFTYEKLLRPFQMQVCMVEEHGNETPNDDELYSLMMEKPSFKQLRIKTINEEFNLLKKAITNLIKEETGEIEEYLKFDLSKTLMKNRIDTYLESLSRMYTKLMFEQNQLWIRMNSLMNCVSYLNYDEYTDYYAGLMNVGRRFREEYIEFSKKVNIIQK